MNVSASRFLSGVAALCCMFFAQAHAAPEGIVSTLDPLPERVGINQFYESVLTVTDANGIGLTGLHLQVRGRMPEHAHGLPTVPQIAEEGQGRYRIKGLSFNMPGRWVIEIMQDGKQMLRREVKVRF